MADQPIIFNLKTHYGIEVVNLTPLSLGADVDAFTYKAQASDHMTYFVKLKDGHHDSSATLQLLLHDTGLKEVISPLKTVHGQPTVCVNNATLTVYPFINGQNGFSQPLTDDPWITLGKP